MEAAVESGQRGVFFVTGAWGLGKRKFLVEGPGAREAGLVVESNIDGIRLAKSMTAVSPILEDVHDVVILDCDRMSMPAQDACLKLLEEPPFPARIWVHAADARGVGPAILSRKRTEFRWSTVPRDEMEKFASTLGDVEAALLDASAGRPGCYFHMRPDPRFRMFHGALTQLMAGSRDLLLEPLPPLLSELDGDSPLRESVFLLLRHAAKSSLPRGVPLLQFASKVLSHTALNVELHWFTALSQMV